MKILALDLGKFNTMCCFFDTNTPKQSFQSASTAASTDKPYQCVFFRVPFRGSLLPKATKRSVLSRLHSRMQLPFLHRNGLSPLDGIASDQ